MTTREAHRVLYKSLGLHGEALYGTGSWFLPNGKPGKWMPDITGVLEHYKNGYHLVGRDHLVEWLGPRLFEAEYKGEMIQVEEKVIVRKARLMREFTQWNDRTARLLACDCAEHVLAIFEKAVPNDSRPRQAIEVARRYAVGEATDEEWDVARAAAWAAWDAVGDAARDAAWDVARAAAWAAGAAAWDVARAAVWAARAAAWDAARDAAWVAVVGAERRWQTERLFFYLDGEYEREQG